MRSTRAPAEAVVDPLSRGSVRQPNADRVGTVEPSLLHTGREGGFVGKGGGDSVRHPRAATDQASIARPAPNDLAILDPRWAIEELNEYCTARVVRMSMGC